MALQLLHFVVMGRKSSAEEGPVHSPIGRHNAMKQKNNHTRNTTEHTKNQTSKKNSDQKQNKGVIVGDIGPYRTMQKKMTSHKLRLPWRVQRSKKGKAKHNEQIRHTRFVRKSNTALRGNQSQICKFKTSNETHVGGETKCETGLWCEKMDLLLPLRFRSESTQ